MEHSFLKLLSGADVLNSLNELQIHSNSTSFLLSAVGDLSMVSFKCPLNEKPIILDKKLGIIILSAYLTSKGSHVTYYLINYNCNLIRGKLFLDKLF